MRLLHLISAIFAFRTVPATVLLVLIYASIFTAVFFTDQLPDPPPTTRVDLDEAYANLHKIAARPHPYNSHANDHVRSYILSRLRSIAAGHPHVHIADDRLSNASWAISNQHSNGSWVLQGSRGVYFEGTNILVKVDGYDPNYLNRDGVLFSAHYDSVSTAPGVTDDGMGVAVLIDMVKHLTTTRPKRTAVFNINNGEEDGLHGAHVFLEHPWSNITNKFLNLEGAAAGGRPLLFRATSTGAIRSFQNKNVRHPHGNVLAADAFARGIIRSGTDYSVYVKGLGTGMDGLDLAFYKGRSKYHTKYDSIPGTVGGKRALWAMMEVARGAGDALLNDDNTSGNWREEGNAVYFDLFGRTLIVFPLRSLLAFNIALAVFGPAIIILLVAIQSLIVYNRRHRQNGGAAHGHSHGWTWELLKNWVADLSWLKTVWRWAKFWLTLALTVGFQVLLVVGYINLNPFIVYSQPHLVLISSLTLSYLSTVLTLRLPIGIRGPQLAEQQKLTVLLQTYVLTWLLLLASTVVVSELGVGGLYFVSAWNAVALLGSVLGCVEVMLRVQGTEGGRVVRFDAPGESQGGAGSLGEEVEAEEEAEEEEEQTERTPLIQRRRLRPSLKSDEGGAIGWWILQAAVMVPVPVILVLHIAVLVLGAMTQTLADGSSPIVVYGAISLLSVLIILPLAPFSFKFHRYVTYLVLILFIGTTVYNWLAFPFSQDAPLKVFFQQKVALSSSAPPDLNNNNNNNSNNHNNNTSSSSLGPLAVRPLVTRTSLTGVKEYLEHVVIPHFPSSWVSDVSCAPALRQGLWTCEWESGLVPDPGYMGFGVGVGVGVDEGAGMENVSESKSESVSVRTWLHVRTERLGPTTARIEVGGANTRACRVYFDSRGISGFRVSGHGSGGGGGGGSGKMQAGYEIGPVGLPVVQLWSRSWGRRFVVDVEWEGGRDDDDDDDDGGGGGGEEEEEGGEELGLSGRVACEWAEYESGRVGDESGEGGKIPALEEVIGFLPLWAVVSKADDGLVEVWQEFEV